MKKPCEQINYLDKVNYEKNHVNMETLPTKRFFEKKLLNKKTIWTKGLSWVPEFLVNRGRINLISVNEGHFEVRTLLGVLWGHFVEWENSNHNCSRGILLCNSKAVNAKKCEMSYKNKFQLSFMNNFCGLNPKLNVRLWFCLPPKENDASILEYDISN